MSERNIVVVQQVTGTSGIAIAGLVFSILGWLTLGLLCIPGVFLCFLALFSRGSKSAAIAGILVGFPGVLFFLFVGYASLLLVLGFSAALDVAGEAVNNRVNAEKVLDNPEELNEQEANESDINGVNAQKEMVNPEEKDEHKANEADNAEDKMPTDEEKPLKDDLAEEEADAKQSEDGVDLGNAAKEFVGEWLVMSDDGRKLFVITLSNDYSAETTNVKDQAGRWEVVGGEVRISWLHDWKDRFVRTGSSYTKFAYKPGMNWDDKPIEKRKLVKRKVVVMIQDEDAAAAKVRLGKSALKQDKKEIAKRWFTEAVEKYPNTNAAKEAEELLKEP